MRLLLRKLITTYFALIFLLLGFSSGQAQSNIQAHYADGQVWVVWDFLQPHPDTFEILGSNTPITQYSDGQQVGRLFAYEYVPGAIREQFALPERGWVIPSAVDAQQDTLGELQGLFVETVHAAGQRFFAVVAYGDTVITPGVNATTVAVNTLYEPGEEVACHLQLAPPTEVGFLSKVLAMWADGREDPEDSRPGFPVCANAAKNGMPSIFIMSGPDDLGPGPHPVTYWLHGGTGRAKQSMPGDRPIYDIDPQEGYLVAHNDDLVRWVGVPAELFEEPTNSWWFGWGIHHDPFQGAPALPPANEIIINYTQRRMVWIHYWLVAQGWVDPEYTSIQGHSMGSAGTTAMGKAFPGMFATCSIFNNGFAGPEADVDHNILGLRTDELKSNFEDANGDSIPVYKVFDLATPLMPGADLPLFRSFHGKNDNNNTMMWDAFVVEQYAKADSLGMGMHLYWDERGHAPDNYPGHWANGYSHDLQTQRDNLAYQQLYSRLQSFPAFFNHRLVSGVADPGNGQSAVGDPWGTWGGYHDWELDSVVDEAGYWEATVFLTDGSAWLPDNAPVDSLLSDLTVRKSQNFQPAPGEILTWVQRNLVGDTIHSGQIVAGPLGHFELPGFTTYRDPARTSITFYRQLSGTGEENIPATQLLTFSAFPNPFNPKTELKYVLGKTGAVSLTIHDLRGRLVRRLVSGTLGAGEHRTTWYGLNQSGSPVSSGIYLARLEFGGMVVGTSLTLIK